MSDHRAAFVSSASQGSRGRGHLVNVTVLGAPRMLLLQLPPPMISGDNEDEEDDSSDVEDLFRDVPINLHLHDGLELAPLDDFGSLQSLPDVNAFARLSLS